MGFSLCASSVVPLPEGNVWAMGAGGLGLPGPPAPRVVPSSRPPPPLAESVQLDGSEPWPGHPPPGLTSVVFLPSELVNSLTPALWASRDPLRLSGALSLLPRAERPAQR